MKVAVFNVFGFFEFYSDAEKFEGMYLVKIPEGGKAWFPSSLVSEIVEASEMQKDMNALATTLNLETLNLDITIEDEITHRYTRTQNLKLRVYSKFISSYNELKGLFKEIKVFLRWMFLGEYHRE